MQRYLKTKTGKRPAVFLDRDGTIIRQTDYPRRESDLKILSGAAKAIKILNQLGYFVVIVSNQPVVARGLITLREAKRLNRVLAVRLKKLGAVIDASYLCPHHPQANVKKYRIVCTCRKPAPGMILQAAREHNLDLKKSFMVGDSTQDVQAGNRAKVKMILVRTGHGGKDSWQHEGKPDFLVRNLVEAASIVAELS
jgi:D,D-heptose 1,7-bisphosphate phosphatase